jgi:hypothetical protein
MAAAERSVGGRFVVTTVKLWRSGNKTSPRLDNVRRGDVSTFDIQGVVYVVALSGGISTFADGPGYPPPPPPPPKKDDKTYWSLAARSPVPAQIDVLLEPKLAGHYLWEPSFNMTMARYDAALANAGQVPPWQRLERVVPTEEVVAAEGAEAAAAGISRGSADGERSASMYASPKTLRFIVTALDTHIGHLADASGHEPLSEDEQADLANDLTLYQLIRQQIQTDHDALIQELRAQGSPPSESAVDEPGGVAPS